MKLGLALAGGGIKGVAHIGVLKAFEENNIKVSYISGASSGSIVAALHSVGYNSNEIFEIFKKYSKKIKYVEYKKIFELLIGLFFSGEIVINGLNSGKSIEKLLRTNLKKKGITNIEEISLPIILPAIDVHTGEVFYFSNRYFNVNEGEKVKIINKFNLPCAVRASCSFPFVFSPYKYGDTELVDGGISENIPWKSLEYIGAEKIIGVVFENQLNKRCCKNLIEVASNSFHIMWKELASYEIKDLKDYIIIKTENIGLLDYSKIDYLYNLGYEMAEKKIEELKLKE